MGGGHTKLLLVCRFLFRSLTRGLLHSRPFDSVLQAVCEEKPSLLFLLLGSEEHVLRTPAYHHLEAVMRQNPRRSLMLSVPLQLGSKSTMGRASTSRSPGKVLYDSTKDCHGIQLRQLQNRPQPTAPFPAFRKHI